MLTDGEGGGGSINSQELNKTAVLLFLCFKFHLDEKDSKLNFPPQITLIYPIKSPCTKTTVMAQ